MATATFSFLLGALKQLKQPAVHRSTETLLHKDHDEFLDRKNRELEEVDRSKFLEKYVGQIQSEFEFRLEKTIFWRDAYIYRRLMSKWFRALCEKYRYDRVALEKVRSDWLSYISLLEQISVYHILGIQSNRNDVRESFRLRASEGRKTCARIEDAFAIQIGKKAVQLLRRVKESEDDAFDRSGNEEMAPDGYHYFCVSFEPYREELRPREFFRSPPQE